MTRIRTRNGRLESTFFYPRNPRFYFFLNTSTAFQAFAARDLTFGFWIPFRTIERSANLCSVLFPHTKSTTGAVLNTLGVLCDLCARPLRVPKHLTSDYPPRRAGSG